jgi:hypothetical protein
MICIHIIGKVAFFFIKLFYKDNFATDNMEKEEEDYRVQLPPSNRTKGDDG